MISFERGGGIPTRRGLESVHLTAPDIEQFREIFRWRRSVRVKRSGSEQLGWGWAYVCGASR